MPETIRLDRRDRIGILTLHRPEVLNALDLTLMRELTQAAADLDRDPDVAVTVITGSERAFAAGADISQMAPRTFSDMYRDDWFAQWDSLTRLRKPLIAAVAGYALGGGCELAMVCDIILAADSARFGQPEVKLGIPPGIGGSQRLARAVGKAKAMEMCLTGRLMTADEAERAGLVARVVPADSLMEEALALAGQIAAQSVPAVMMVKECVNRAFESSLSEGLLFERRLFYAAFAMEDQKEGMAAFLEKRSPSFSNR